jgi:hypothetical protein
MCYKHFLRSSLYRLLLAVRHPQFVNIRETEVPFCYTSCVSYNLLLLFSHCCHDLLQFFFFYYFSKCGFEVYPPSSKNATPTSVFVMEVRHCYSTILVVCAFFLCFVSFKTWCNESHKLSKIISREYARCLAYLKYFFEEIRSDIPVMRIKISWRYSSVSTPYAYSSLTL